MHGFFTSRILSGSFDYSLIEWDCQAAWLKARRLSLAVNNVGDLTAPSVSYLIIYLRTSLGLPTEVEPDRIYRKSESSVDSHSKDITFLRLLCYHLP